MDIPTCLPQLLQGATNLGTCLQKEKKSVFNRTKFFSKLTNIENIPNSIMTLMFFSLSV